MQLLEHLPVYLVVFHILFFWKWYARPFELATSELLSTFYPSWVWMGRQARKLKSWKIDRGYWLNYHAHPVLSSFYPPHVLTAWIGSFLNLDGSFRLLVGSMAIHVFAQSVFWFVTLSCYFVPPTSLFLAITLSYAAWNIRCQPCIS